MKQLILAILVCLTLPATLLAQVPVHQVSPEAKQRAKDRSDYSLFRRQITSLKEFGDERRKIPALQKENKEPIKIIAVIDSVDSDSGDTTKNKFITGFITQQIGDNSTNAYELTFDRTLRKITSIKRTGESAEPEATEPKAKPKTTATKTTDAKKPVVKKKKTGDDDDDEEDEKEEKEPKEKDE